MNDYHQNTKKTVRDTRKNRKKQYRVHMKKANRKSCGPK
jgi:hypothetical protein